MINTLQDRRSVCKTTLDDVRLSTKRLSDIQGIGSPTERDECAECMIGCGGALRSRRDTTRGNQ